MSLILLIILVLLLVGALPAWPYSSGWGYYPSVRLGLILLIVIILALAGRICVLHRQDRHTGNRCKPVPECERHTQCRRRLHHQIKPRHWLAVNARISSHDRYTGDTT